MSSTLSNGRNVLMSDLNFELEELRQAADAVHAVVAPTPLYAWPKLCNRLGCRVLVKHENHTPTGAFKVRGGLIYAQRLRQSQPKVTGLISATRGNHGQSIAFAAARSALQATIYVPHGNSPDQNSSIAGFGAKVVEFGRDFEEARQEAHRVANLEGLHFVPSYHRDLVLGVSSYALEIFQTARDLDAVYVSVGMGSGICGLIAMRDAMGLKTEIIGVCAAGAPATALSFAAGNVVVTAAANTFADGVATRNPDPQAIAAICRGAARIVKIEDDAIAEAVRIYYDDTHQVAEGAGAAPLGALIQECERMANKSVALVLSGGNIERARFSRVLAGNTPSAT
jgi:threonine dehydratase